MVQKNTGTKKVPDYEALVGMSSRTPRKVAVSIDVVSFEREASLSSWRIGAAVLRGKVNKGIDFETDAQMRQKICVASSAVLAFVSSKSQLLILETSVCAQ